MQETINKRIFVGGLASEVTSGEIMERFSKFGKVANLSLKTRKDESGNRINSFAHLDLEADEANIKKCFSTFQNTKWKGSVLQLQYAKESFLQKLEKEREEAQNEQDNILEVKPSQTSQPQLFEFKGPAVPGTPVPGMKDWVVGKYGRVLPILKLKKSYKIKMMKYDPSKHCHAARVFKDDKTSMPADTSCNKLTWDINTPDSEITRKRKGEFPQTSSCVQKIKKVALTPSEYFRNKELARKIEEVEVVKVGAGNVTKLMKSNRFDSDLESDSEGDNISQNVSNRLQMDNNEKVRLKANETRVNKNTVLGSAGKELAVSASGRKNGTVTTGQKVKVIGGTEASTSPAVKHSLQKVEVIGATEASTSPAVKHSLQKVEVIGATEASTSPAVKHSLQKVEVIGAAEASTSPAVKHSLQKVEVIGATEASTSPAVKHSLQKENSTFNKMSKFKGLGMLGLMQDCTRTCQEKLEPTNDNFSVDRLHVVTMASGAVDESTSSHSVSDKSAYLRSLCGSKCESDGGNNSSPNSTNTSANSVNQKVSKLKEQKQSSQKSSAPVKDKCLPMRNKQPILLHSLPGMFGDDSASENDDSSSSVDTDEIIARCKRRKLMKPSTATVSEPHSGNSAALHSLEKTKHSPEEFKQLTSSVTLNDIPDMLEGDSSLKRYDSSSSADTDEIIARCKRRKRMVSSDRPVAEIPSENVGVSNSAGKCELLSKQNKQANSTVLKNDLVDMVKGDMALRNYDSASSADTDEIIKRCKRRKGLAPSAITVSKTLSGKSKATNNVRRNEHETQANLSNSVKGSSVDGKLSLSEFVSGMSPPPLPASDILKQEDSLYDSDLDSNDFALVAKKLLGKNVSSKMDNVANNKLRNGKIDSTTKQPDNCKKIHENVKVSTVGAVTGAPKKNTSWMKDSFGQVSQHEKDSSDADEEEDDDDEEEDDDDEEEEGDTDEEDNDDVDEEEDDDDVDEDCEEETRKPSTDDKRLKEKNDSLKVTQNVVGKISFSPASEKLKNCRVPIIDMNALRFDPTKIQKAETVAVGQIHYHKGR